MHQKEVNIQYSVICAHLRIINSKVFIFIAAIAQEINFLKKENISKSPVIRMLECDETAAGFAENMKIITIMAIISIADIIFFPISVYRFQSKFN